MARIAVADGVGILACTPHITPGVYDNSGPEICSATVALQVELDRAEIPLLLVPGADVHLDPNLLEGLRSGRVQPLGTSRYFLLEPPQGVLPPRFEESVFALISAGYLPIVTHPERISWVESHYEVLERLVRSGVWMQITARSILGGFGRRAQSLAERMLEDGLVHIIASDAHDTKARKPGLSDAFYAVEQRLGSEEAMHLVRTRPAGILKNDDPDDLPAPRPREALAQSLRTS